MKVISYNVNGIRSAIKKELVAWLKAANADVVCFQETKALKAQVPLALFEDLGYETYWNSAEKKGYSGVAIFTKIKPQGLVYGYGEGSDLADPEGRLLRADFENISVMSVYVPSGSSGGIRQDFKMQWMNQFYDYISRLLQEKPNLLICGDYNICHKPIDIHNPQANAKSSGFLPEEREWLSKFMELGFIDTFRFFNQEPHQYTWWSSRSNAREKNLGWRIDYHLITQNLEERLKRALILNEAKHSDHCPILVEVE
ncbi:MAG: exodeoxyribonuclease III [Microscillaceae bacterium]|nr:exodeoxyribonuclease III [Microscillaceae bacterium]